MESIWRKTCEIPEREALQKDISTEVAVIGAGMAGILIGYLLQQAGKKVVILEADRIASGQTQNTTAKITSQHGLIYTELVKTKGEKAACQYAQANEAAIAEYRRIIEHEQIDCDFEEQSAYLYGKNAEVLKQEALAATSFGIPAVFMEDCPLFRSQRYAVRFDKQAQFHPLKFLKHLAAQLTIYEKTPVQTVEDYTLHTPNGIVTAKYIIFAAHYPFVNFPGLYFARMHQERSYVLALEYAPNIDGMYIGDGNAPYSFRTYKNYLLFGGEGHRTGENQQGGRYEALRKKARELFPEAKEAAHWSAQDCIPADHVPYIGEYTITKDNWYVATGFQKWGMTSSMVAAMLLRDRICEKENPFAEVFDPQRFSMEEASSIACESKHAVKTLTKRFFEVPESTAAEIPAGHGGIVMIDGEKIGIYKDENGILHMVDIRCPHLGCQLEWNPDEKSWDCPCHGSRFDFTGKLLNNPAQENISLSKK